MYTPAEGILYFLAIVLASYAVWEKLPEGKSAARNLAFAGALLTLFLTFFLTSLAIDEMGKEIKGLKDRIDLNDEMARLAGATDAPGRAAFETVKGLLEQFSKLPRDITLSNGEGIDLISKILQHESKLDHPEDLHIIAISIDPKEFDNLAASSSDAYEGGIRKIAEHGKVERIYVLSEKKWLDAEQQKFSSSHPWEIPQQLQDIGLGPIGQHQKAGVHCFLIKENVMPGGNKSDYDLIVMWRTLQNKPEPQFVFGANRRSNGKIDIHFGNDSANGGWLQNCLQIRETPGGVITIPEYRNARPAQSRPLDNR